MAGYTRGHLTRLSKDGHAESGRERSRQPEMMSCGSLTPPTLEAQVPPGGPEPGCHGCCLAQQAASPC